MDGNQFVLLTCLLGQIENYNTMIIPPIKGEILLMCEILKCGHVQKVLQMPQKIRGQVLRIHCVIHTSRGMYKHTNPSVTRRTESHDQAKVTKGKGADFFRTAHRMDTCIKKANYFQRSFNIIVNLKNVTFNSAFVLLREVLTDRLMTDNHK